MYDVFAGVRVVELAEWAMVPSAAAVLADFGAEVVKVEPVARGDAMRGLAHGGGSPMVEDVSLVIEQANRNKRSIGVDLTTVDGHRVLEALVARSDVVLTSFLPQVQAKLAVTAADIHAINPAVVYARGHGAGRRGPDAERAGYDTTAYWARSGMGYSLTPDPHGQLPRSRPGFGDRAAAMNLAFGIAAGLYRRERTGRGATVDVSLLGTALWQIANDVSYTSGTGVENSDRSRDHVPNPLSHTYVTSDGRVLSLGMLQSDRFWPEVCRVLDAPELLDDPRFADASARTDNSGACVSALQERFGRRPLAVWRTRLAVTSGPWELVQSVTEVLDDPQVSANSYVRRVDGVDDGKVVVVSAPVEFDEDADYPLRRAPEHGADTENVLLELGYDWERIAQFKESGAVL